MFKKYEIKDTKRLFYIILFLSVSLALIVLPGPSQGASKPIEGVVTYVVDGDTVWAKTKGGKLKIRLYGIDAPETGHGEKPGQPFGRQVANALRSKVLGKKVAIEVRDIDSYGRSVAVIRLNGRDINLEMAREGWAWAYRRYLERPYASEYIRAEKEARGKKLGLWKQSNPQPPWEFRRSISND